MTTDCFDHFYSQVSSIKNTLLRKGLRYGVRMTANTVLPFIYKFGKAHYSLKQPQKQRERLIVTLTSFPPRIGKLHIVCESLLRQTQKPNMIIIWLSKQQFRSIEVLPKNLLELQSRGVQIRLVDEDIRSHKKYYYALTEFPNDLLLIIDDDIYYRSTMIAELLDYHKRSPKAIIAQYGRKIERNNGNILSYEKWKKIKDIEVENGDVFFGSGGGTLIPPHTLYEDVCRKDLFLKLAPLADDVWLNAMARLQGIKIVKTKYYSSNLELMYKHNKTLASVNNTSHQNMNDVQIENLSTYYGEKLIW